MTSLKYEENKLTNFESLSLSKPQWKWTAVKNGMTTEEWATQALDNATLYDIEKVKFLDDINYKELSRGVSPHPFQLLALRHWGALTQADAAKLIGFTPSAYRNCEIDDNVLMKPEYWHEYVNKVVELVYNQDYKYLPNAYGRSIRGLTDLNYRQLNNLSSLSQSYWTGRLRFKSTPMAIETDSICELLKLSSRHINKCLKQEKVTEVRLLLTSLLFFAYQTQKVRVHHNPSLISPYHYFNNNKGRRNLDINRFNLFYTTLQILNKKGYSFTDSRSNMFIEINELGD